MTDSVNTAPVSEIAAKIREDFANTGQIDRVDLNRVLGSQNDVIEFKASVSADPIKDLINNYASESAEL